MNFPMGDPGGSFSHGNTVGFTDGTSASPLAAATTYDIVVPKNAYAIVVKVAGGTCTVSHTDTTAQPGSYLLAAGESQEFDVAGHGTSSGEYPATIRLVVGVGGTAQYFFRCTTHKGL
jgi:hypothetical protein